MKQDKLEKLKKMEKSAREIGSIGEADNFKKKIDEILAKVEKKVIDCLVECSCGWTMDITIDAGNLSQTIFNNMLQPHLQAKHTVKIYDRNAN